MPDKTNNSFGAKPTLQSAITSLLKERVGEMTIGVPFTESDINAPEILAADVGTLVEILYPERNYLRTVVNNYIAGVYPDNTIIRKDTVFPIINDSDGYHLRYYTSAKAIVDIPSQLFAISEDCLEESISYLIANGLIEPVHVPVVSWDDSKSEDDAVTVRIPESPIPKYIPVELFKEALEVYTSLRSGEAPKILDLVANLEAPSNEAREIADLYEGDIRSFIYGFSNGDVDNSTFRGVTHVLLPDYSNQYELVLCNLNNETNMVYQLFKHLQEYGFYSNGQTQPNV